MLSRKTLIIFTVLLTLAMGFSTRIFATPNSTTIEIYQDLNNPLTGNGPNSLSIEKSGVIILNNNLERLKLFNLSKSDTDVFITLVSGGNKLVVYKNGKKESLISLNGINLSSFIDNLQNSFDDGHITYLQISGFALSPKRVLKSYLDFSESNLGKHLKEKIVTDSNLKLYYSASNIDNMNNFADPTDMISTWTDLSGNKNNATLTNFALTPSPTTSSGQVVTSGWDGNNVFSNPSRLTFDGANDYVQPADSSPFNFTAMTPFTIEFWINLAVQPSIHKFFYIISKKSGYLTPGYEIFSYINTLYIRITGIAGQISLLNSPPTANTWKHVVLSYDGSSKASGVKLYYDAVLQSNVFVAKNQLSSSDNFNAGALRLGATSFGELSFKGSLGDVRIYNKALSQSEVLQNFYSEQSKYFQAPNITSLSPKDSSTGVAVQSDLVIEFDQIISKGTGNIKIKKTSNISSVETIEVGSDRVTVSGMTVTINPENNLIGGNSYSIEIDQNAFKYNGVSFPGILDTKPWSFTTLSDSTQAKVTSFSPENGSQNVPVAADLVLTFDKNVYPGTGVINIFDQDSNEPIEVIKVNSSAVTGGGTNTITINPSMNFSSDTQYILGIDPNAFQDGAGNNSKPIDPWLFLTVDTTPLNVVNLSPADDATNISANTNLQITFNKPVTVLPGSIFIKKSNDNSTVQLIIPTGPGAIFPASGDGTETITIMPFKSLEPNTEYYVNINPNVFRDAAGNNFTGIMDNFTWNFKTADTVAPTIKTLSPLDEANKVNVNSDLIIVFSEPVLAKAGNIAIYKVTSTPDPPIETINVTSNLIMGSGTDTITINPAKDLQEDVRYYINIDSTAFTDLSGNAFSGISARSTWNFTTLDVTPPTITNLSPADNATKINVNSNLQITFSEIASPQAGGKKINLFKSGNTTPVESIDVTNNAVTGIGSNIITVNPSMDFAENTNYFITIAQGAFADFTGNAFSGILNDTTWNFKTADTTEPTIVGLFPLKNAVDVNIGTNLIITFSEPVTANAGNITIKNIVGDLVLATVDVTSNAVTGKGTNIIAVALPANLAGGTNYYVNIDPGAFFDLEGNGFIGITDNTTWSFKTVVPKNIEGGNIGGSNISGCSFTRCGQLCCINGCCPKNQGTCIDFPNCFASSSGSSNISSSSSGGFSPSSSSSSSSSSSGGSLFFNSDGSLSTITTSPITITGPNVIKLPTSKAKLTASHTNVMDEIKCSVIPLGDIKISVKPKNLSFTPTVTNIDIKLKFKPKNVLKARKDKSERNVQIKLLCDDGEGNLDIKILP